METDILSRLSLGISRASMKKAKIRALTISAGKIRRLNAEKNSNTA